jgi:hypothetical protein
MSEKSLKWGDVIQVGCACRFWLDRRARGSCKSPEEMIAKIAGDLAFGDPREPDRATRLGARDA